MADPLAITILRAKRDEIEREIAHLEDLLKQANTDLLHVNATLRLFELDNGEAGEPTRVYMDLSRAFKRLELRNLCKAALAASGKPMTTRDLADYVLKAKRWDESDRALRTSITFKIVNVLRLPSKRDGIERLQKHRGVNVWRLRE